MIEKLLEKYNTGYYSANESELRKDIINQFFNILGWDLDNKKSLPFYQREVVVEETVNGKNPDYSFRKTSKKAFGEPPLYFFVEAKQANLDLHNKDFFYQAMGYGYSGTTKGGLPLVILFNFEHLIILDCTEKPDKSHTLDFLTKFKVLKEYSKNDLQEKWKEIENLLSKKAVEKGSLAKLLEEKVKGDRFVSLDQDFLKDFWHWHHDLTKDIINQNPQLQFRRNNAKKATETATRILNRLVFLKVCEDRETEPQDRLYKTLVDKTYQGGESHYRTNEKDSDIFVGEKTMVKNSFKEFLKLCEEYHIKYNSDLFNIEKDKTESILISGDTKQDFSYYDLKISDNILQNITETLHFSPYIFSIVPVEVLGYIYEQFLSYKQNYDYETNQTKIEKDKSKKSNKDGGIYYTPKPIVNFTIEKTMESVDFENKTMIDPACGSGTYLIGWFEYLTQKYLQEYAKNKSENIEKDLIRLRGEDQVLTLHTKKEIVTNQIFGVDMDREAVEIAKLSLCLKVLEGETNATIEKEKEQNGDPALPTLNENIKAGNSLLQDKNELTNFFAENENEYILQPFNWQEEYPKIFEKGGFDLVFANPPYISMKKFPKDQVSMIYKKSLLDNYTTFTKKSDIYCCFFELALKKDGILKNGGRLGFITSSTYFAESSFHDLRQLLLSHDVLYYTIPRADIFKPRASVKASIIGIEKNGLNEDKEVEIYEGKSVNDGKNNFIEFEPKNTINLDLVRKFDVLFTQADEKTIKILQAVSSFIPFDQIAETKYGCATGDNSVWLFDKTGNKNRKQWMEDNENIFRGKTNLKPYYKGENIDRYYLHPTKYEVNYLPEEMKRHRTTARPGDVDNRFEDRKIIIADIGEHLSAYLDDGGVYVDIANLVFIKNDNYQYSYLLALYNSKLVNTFFNLIRSNLHFQSKLIKRLTIPPATPEQQQEIAREVKKISDLYHIFYKEKDSWTPQKLKEEEDRLVRVEYNIDKMVCSLYGLDYDEIFG